MSTDAPASRMDQTFKLLDGRTLGFAEYGATEGKTLLYFHGFPSSRVEAKPIQEIALKNGIRCIAIDRPGFGLSTPLPGRHLLDWTRDVQEFARGMNLDKFAVMGLSGGGPYAMACAYALPRHMLTGVGLFASGPPWAAGLRLMTRTRQAMRFLCVYWPSALKVILDSCVGLVRWLSTKQKVRDLVDKKVFGASTEGNSIKPSGAPDTTAAAKPLDDKAVSKRLDELVRTLVGEPFLQGSNAAVQEARILSDPDWGFKLEEVTYPKVFIWHGVKDINAPIVAMRYLADKVPNAVLKETDDTHYTMGRQIEGAVLELMAEDHTKS